MIQNSEIQSFNFFKVSDLDFRLAFSQSVAKINDRSPHGAIANTKIDTFR